MILPESQGAAYKGGFVSLNRVKKLNPKVWVRLIVGILRYMFVNVYRQLQDFNCRSMLHNYTGPPYFLQVHAFMNRHVNSVQT